MKSFVKYIVLGLLALTFNLGAGAQGKPYEPYFVSGVLKLNGSEATIKVVQGMVVSDSPENARVVFMGLALRQFPDYTIVDSIASNFAQLYKTLPSNSSPSSGEKPQLRNNI